MRYSQGLRTRFTTRSLCEALESRVLLSGLPAISATPPAVTHHAVKEADESDDSFWSDDSAWDDSSDSSSDSSSNSTSDSSDDGSSFWDDMMNDGSDSSTQPSTGPSTQPESPPDTAPWDDSGSYVNGSGDNGSGDYYDQPVYNLWCPPAPCRPATPYGLNAVPLNATAVRLTWHGDIFNTTGYRILRLGPGQPAAIIACVPGSTTCFVDTRLAANTTYTYAVSAFNSVGTSGYSRPVNASTPDGRRPPVGFVDVASATTVKGWTVDPDMPGQSVAISATLDGAPVATQTAAGYRPDLFRTYHSANHGFSFGLPTLTPGSHRVDIFATDTVTGARSRIASRTINRAPTGFLDRIDRSTLAGWAFDADAGAGAIRIRYSIDNQPPRLALANTVRSDLVAHVGSANHGFTIRMPKITAAPHLVTVYAIDPASGKLTLLGRRWIPRA